MGIHYPFWMVLSMMLQLSLIGLAGALLIGALFICACRTLAPEVRDWPNPSPRRLVDVTFQLLCDSFFRLAQHLFQCVKMSCLPHHINSVIYKYIYSCGSDYVDLRIRQHLPARIWNLRLKRGQLANTSRSSIAEHMISSRECVADFNVDQFSIQSRSHSPFHLKVLETHYVRSLQPSLCKQRDCLLGLNVISL